MMSETNDIENWLESPDKFRAAVEFTAAETGFVPALIEKDFWCSLILWRLFRDPDCPLVFKGGTLLSKAYVVFNRLSEDLDFTLPTDDSVTRGQRSRRTKEIAAGVAAATVGLPVTVGEWASFHISTQQQVVLEYASVFGGHGTIKLEVGQREVPILPVISVPLSNLLLNLLFNEAAVAPIRVSALSSTEAYAEKLRAALTRRDPAPRDLYDLHHAVESDVLDWNDEEFLRLAARKIATQTPTDWLAAARIEAFRRGLASELRPVLRPDIYQSFDFTNALATMTNLANAMRPYL